MLIYRILITLFAAVVLTRAALRQGRAALAARLGRGGPRDGTRRIWLHAASNGELSSVRPVIRALGQARPDLGLVVTCNSDSGVALAREMGLEARLAPVDLVSTTRAFLKGWGVVAHLALESELWPNRVLLTPGPVLVLGGRMSAKTAENWARLPKLAARLLGRIAFLSAQDRASRDRFLSLGLPEAAAGPVTELKALYDPPAEGPPDPALEAAYPRGRTWLAASTHKGEEEAVIAAHLEARKSEPGLRLILALRHPHRAGEVAALLRAAGLDYALRSRGDAPAEVLLADTLGEMPRWYRLAGRVFIGGTLTDRGGHTPFEPAWFGAALLHGPDVANFARPFARLLSEAAAVEVEEAEDLAQALTALADPEDQARAGEAARSALRPEEDLERLMARITAVLPR
ncbi:3-deoxy-D-manno-octulosonic acid transferase [Roseivivax sp.]